MFSQAYKPEEDMPESTIVRVALAQINTTVGDFKGNIEKISRNVEAARERGADIALFPELALCGYPPEDLLLRPAFLAANARVLEKLIPACGGICAIVGYAEQAGADVFNSAAVIDRGAQAATHRKIELPNYGVFDEKRYFKSGTDVLIFELGGVRFAVTICEDIWVEGGRPERGIIECGADVVLNLSASPFHAGKGHKRENLVAGLAGRTNAFVCYTNLVGGQDEVVFDGGAIVAGPDGRLVSSSPRFTENLHVVDLEVRPGPRRPSAVRRVALEPEKIVRGVAEAPSAAPELSEVEEIYSALVLGTRDYVLKNGFSKVIIGLSGGIDSALTAAIAVDALGKDNVTGVTMPSEYTSVETKSDAELLAENLGIRLFAAPISSTLAAYLDVLREPFGAGAPGLEKENLQARIRGNILMALSNRFGWLVLTTGNKSEMAVGYCTLYGDMAGGFAVIKDVPKTMVYRLSAYVNEKAGGEIIPQSTIDRPPTAELRPNQKDEDSIPPYDVLDPILHEYVELDKSRGEIAAMGFDPETVRDVILLVDRSEYKRRQAPPGVKITPKAFGRDRRLPLTNRFTDNTSG
jgi:NAD+ synthase (glutamine-hydrolysing)